MTTLPTWWIVISGVCFMLMIIFLIILIAVVLFLGRHLQELASKVGVLADRSQKILEHSEGIATQVHKIAKDISTPAANIFHRVDDVTSKISQVVEKGSMLMVGIAAINKLLSLFRDRARAKSNIQEP